MLLTEIIKNSTTAIERYRAVVEKKQNIDSYKKALSYLEQSIKSLQQATDCAVAMQASEIVTATVMDEATRDELLDCINNCGNGVAKTKLTLESVKLLQSKVAAVESQLKIVWGDAASSYAAATKGYLTTIGGLSSNPARAREIIVNIDKATTGKPSPRAIDVVTVNVSAAKKIVDDFALNADIESFLHKVSSHQATISDLTPTIMDWLREKNLMGKLQITF